MVAAPIPRFRLSPAERLETYRRCMSLLRERDALRWWRWARRAAINHEIRMHLDSMEDAS